jgi:hypothetical protein
MSLFRRGRLCAAAALVVGVAGASEAQGLPGAVQADTDMVTDRPDFTESSEVIPRGRFQFESGFNYETDGDDELSRDGITAPAALLRIGLGGRTELRIGADGFLWQSAAGEVTSGYSDLELGLKIRLLDQEDAGIDVAVIPSASIPIGADRFTSGHVDPTVKLTWARELPAGFGVTGNINVALVSDAEGRYMQRAVSVSLGRDLVGQWVGFVEAYGFAPMYRDTSAGITLDWGVSRQVGRSVQFDVEIGRGLTTAASDWFIGFGFAIRGKP